LFSFLASFSQAVSSNTAVLLREVSAMLHFAKAERTMHAIRAQEVALFWAAAAGALDDVYQIFEGLSSHLPVPRS
jgi:hypothetical protein